MKQQTTNTTEQKLTSKQINWLLDLKDSSNFIDNWIYDSIIKDTRIQDGEFLVKITKQDGEFLVKKF